jgi:hypothetical protein
LGNNLVNSYKGTLPMASQALGERTLPGQNRICLFTTLAVATLLIVCMAATGAVSAQTFNPQQPPDFGNFNGTRPDFGGNPSDFNGSEGFPFGGGMGPDGDFNGTFPGRGDGNFSRPDFSGAPNQFGPSNTANPAAVSGSQNDYMLIIASAVAVVTVVVVAGVLLVRKTKAVKTVSASPAAQENFDF